VRKWFSLQAESIAAVGGARIFAARRDIRSVSGGKINRASTVHYRTAIVPFLVYWR
jgi:hypothetical protein